MKISKAVCLSGSLAFCLLFSFLGFVTVPVQVVAGPDDSVFMEADSIFQLAKMKMKKRKYAEAEQLLRQLAALNFPDSKKSRPIIAGTHLVLVDSLMRQKKWKQALKDGHRALKLRPYSKPSIYKADMLKMLGKAFGRTGNDEKATKYLEDSIAMFKKVRSR